MVICGHCLFIALSLMFKPLIYAQIFIRLVACFTGFYYYCLQGNLFLTHGLKYKFYLPKHHHHFQDRPRWILYDFFALQSFSQQARLFVTLHYSQGEQRRFIKYFYMLAAFLKRTLITAIVGVAYNHLEIFYIYYRVIIAGGGYADFVLSYRLHSRKKVSVYGKYFLVYLRIRGRNDLYTQPYIEQL